MQTIKSAIWLLQLVSMFVLGLYFGAAILSLNAQEPSQFRSDIIAEYPLGHLDAGKYTLSLTLADLGGVGESVFDATPDMARNFYTVSARPRHAGNLMMPDFAANCRDGVAEGEH